MILARTRTVLQRRGASTLSEVAAELSVDRARADAALCYWIHRGVVQTELIASPGCAPAACSGCALAARCPGTEPTATGTRVFRWLSPQIPDVR